VSRPLDVVLCGYYGFGNLGDELMAESLLGLLKKNGVPGERIAILSAAQGVAADRGEASRVDRWSPLEVMSALRSSRTLLLGGGGLFQDSTSTRSCAYYWGVARMARLAGCRPWAFGQSIGPLERGMARFLARDALSLCRARVVRDRGSMSLLEEWDLAGEIAPDPVFSMAPGFSSGSGDLLLVNVRPWRGGLPEAASLAATRAGETSGLDPIGVALSGEDESLMEDLRSRGELTLSRVVRVVDASEARELWSKARAAVGMRLHFCLISVLAGVPCLAVPYDPKVRSFAEDWGLPLWDGVGLPPFPLKLRHDARLDEARGVLEEVFRRALEGMLSGE